MQISPAEQISLRSFLNAFFKENHAEFKHQEDSVSINYVLQPFGFELKIPLTYYSLTGRHQFSYPAQLTTGADVAPHTVHPWCLLGLLMQDLSHRHPKASVGHREFMHKFFDSCENLDVILNKLSRESIDELFANKVSFEAAENGLLAGHQLHPAPKSREGFTKQEFASYSPELQGQFQLHYFAAKPEIVFTQSELAFNANELVRKYFLTESIDNPEIIIPVHPWQANYILQLPAIKKLLANNTLVYLGPLGDDFTATTSVRTVYSQRSPFMAKLSLNIAITNSVRVNYARELVRGVAAHRFWHSQIGLHIQESFPSFQPITDPAFLCLKDGDTVIQETAVLFRGNPFMHADNNVTPLATLCQDHPFTDKNRFSDLLAYVARQHAISLQEAALMWFKQFLDIAVKPILWTFVNYGVAIEAHQQNLLIELDEGLPVKSYYRDNQGYYVVDSALPELAKTIDSSVLDKFCAGTKEFITHHFTYYLICNSVFGVINALGTTGAINETILIRAFSDFISQQHNDWPASNYMLPQLLESETLPFKGNLLTRFYALDELTSPIEQQSVYLDIENIIKKYAHNLQVR